MAGHKPFKNLYLIPMKECIEYGDFTLHSGDKSNWKCDLMKMRETFYSLTNLLQCSKNIPTVGIMTGGAFLAYAHNPYNCGIVLPKENKVYLPQEWGDGRKVNLIDDVVTTESSIKEAIKLLKKNDIIVSEIFTILDRRVYKEITIHSLFTTQDLIDEDILLYKD